MHVELEVSIVKGPPYLMWGAITGHLSEFNVAKEQD